MLADVARRILLFDVGSQHSLSRLFKVTSKTLSAQTRFRTTHSCISQTSIPGLDVVIFDDEKIDGKMIAAKRRKSLPIPEPWVAPSAGLAVSCTCYG
jgi:hypothetical protein